MLFILFSLVQSQIYEIDITLNYTYQFTNMTIDISTSLSTHQQLNENYLKCNESVFGSPLTCTACEKQLCQMQIKYPDNSISLVNLQQEKLSFTDYQGKSHTEEFIYGIDSQSILGLGVYRGNGYPQNPFLTDVISTCFGNSRGFITKNDLQVSGQEIKYTTDSGQYNVNPTRIIFDIKSIPITEPAVLDSIFPYISLPSGIYEQLVDWIGGAYQFESEGRFLIYRGNDKKLKQNMPIIQMYFDNSLIKIYPEQYVLRIGNQIGLGFIKSNSEQMKLGVIFMQQKFITFDQENKIIRVSEMDCQSMYHQVQQRSLLGLIFLVIGLILAGLYFFKYKPIKKQITQKQQELPHVRIEDEDL